ncbi:MAG: HAD family hydrolase [Actinomycetota bacterium]
MNTSVFRYDAVIFDLFGTLVPEFGVEEFRVAVAEAARMLGVDPDAFLQGWEATAMDRQLGTVGTVEDNVHQILGTLQVDASDERIVSALEPRRALYRRLFRPHDEAVHTLSELRRWGYPLGLISMCSPDTPELWRTSPLAGSVDVEVFSCEVGLRKPDPEIYRYCTDRLGVEPSRCLYVGDGAYGELSGAAALGMEPVLIRHTSEGDTQMLRPEADEWDGTRIERLPQVLELV